MKIRVLQKGDKVIGVTTEFIAVRRKNGEVDLIKILNEGGMLRINTEDIVTIGFGDNIVEVEDEDGGVISTF